MMSECEYDEFTIKLGEDTVELIHNGQSIVTGRITSELRILLRIDVLDLLRQTLLAYVWRSAFGLTKWDKFLVRNLG